MTRLRIIKQRITFVMASAMIYFCLDYFIYKTSFLQSYSFIGFKSFLPMVLGLNFGLYGVIGELAAIIIKSLLTKPTYEFIYIECVIVIVMGIGSWFLWHVQSYTHRIRFRYVANYVRYILITVSLSLICAIIGWKLVNIFAFEDILVWSISMSILVGIPVEIIYGGLMSLNPIIPPIKVAGKRIELKDDISYTLDNKPESIAILNEKVEELLFREKVDMKRMFEIQNVVEEVYLRILKKYSSIVIDIKANYDITFSIEYLFIEKKYNPFRVGKDEDKMDLAGLSIIKHKALLATYNYNYGLNRVHIVI